MTQLAIPSASSAAQSAAPDDLPLSTEVFQLLKRSGAMEEIHTGRTLFAHLHGTYLLLKSWGRPEPVCLA